VVIPAEHLQGRAFVIWLGHRLQKKADKTTADKDSEEGKSLKNDAESGGLILRVPVVCPLVAVLAHLAFFLERGGALVSCSLVADR